MSSFSDKLKEAQTASTISPASYSLRRTVETNEPAVMTLSNESELIAAYSGEEWEKPKNASFYDYYTEYSDDKYSTLDDEKGIVLSDGQVNLTQEKNSQYIPFRINRRYDGFDLATTKLSFYWVNKLGHGGTMPAVDVYCTQDKLKFALLVDDNMTAVAGDLSIEIHAEGTNSLGRGYLWKTKPNKKLNVIQALEIKSFIEPDETWQTSFIEKLSAQADRAEVAALSAEASATVAQNLVNELQDGLADEVQNVIGENYYTKTETHTYVAQEIGKVDVSDQLKNYAKTSEVEALVGDIGESESVVGYINDAIAGVDVSEQLKEYALRNEIPDISGKSDIGHTHTLSEVTDYEEPDLSGYALKTDIPSIDGLATEKYVQDEIEKIDVTEQLVAYAKTDYVDEKIGNLTLPSKEVEAFALEENTYDNVTDFVIAAMDSVDVSEQLENYYTRDEVDDAIDNVTVDLTGYATEEYVGQQISPVNSAITTINQTLEGIDKSPKTKYRATYGDVELEDGSIAEHMFTLWKEENGVEEVQDRFKIAGGGGGSDNNVSLQVKYVDGYGVAGKPIIYTVNDKAIIKYIFEGVDSAGDYVSAKATWKVGSKTVLTEEINSGENEVDLTNFVGVGENKISLNVTHEAGGSTPKNWTIKVVDVRLESFFDNTRPYTAGSPVEFTFVPHGSVDKVVHFKLDGVEIGTKESKSAAATLSDSYILPSQEHGSHLLEAWMTSDIANSNHIFRDIVWYDENSEKPVIGCSTPELTVTQHDTNDIYFTVFDPTTETPTVIVEDNGEIIETLTGLNTGSNKYPYVATTVGSHEITFVCRDERKTITVVVEELNIPITPVTASLAFDFNPVGYSNNSENRLWSYESEVEGNTVTMSVSDNFDWINGGYQQDKDGSYFCIKAGTTATINYKMFCATKDISSQGGHYKLVFKTMNVQDASKPFLQCYKDNVGVIMQPHETNFYAGSGNTLYLAYSENDTIEFELNMGEEILNSSDKMVMGYEDGVATKPLVYTSGASFIQGIQDSDAEYITLGSTSCDLYIYRFKAYRKALTSKEVINNFITDARSASEMLKRYNRNNIYNEAVSDLNISTGYSEAYIEHFAKCCPDLRVIMISAPRFTNDKKDYVSGTVARQIYANGREFADNWTVYNIQHSGQGTSSNLYHASGRNIDLIMNKNEDAWIEFADGTILSGKDLRLNLTETSVPINYLNIKLNIASSENANNEELARRYNKFNPYKRPLVREEGYPYEVKDTMEFYNCVVFIQETDTNQDVNGNYTQHMEFNDCNWHYYGLGNIGDSKKTDDTRMNDPNDVNEFVIEIMDNNLPNSKFQSGIEDEKGYSITGAAAKESWDACEKGTFEKVYTEVTNSSYLIKENLPIFYELVNGEYVLTSDETISPSKTYYELNYPNPAYAGMYIDKYFLNNKGKVEQEQGWAISFECRYEHDDSDHDEHIRIWNEFYKFVIFSSDDEFYKKLGDYCVLDSVMFYYLFTLRYTMIDNRGKNTFWHYGKCKDGKYRWDLTMDYDNDTALGINNLGEQVYRYGYEDFDVVDSDVSGGGSWVFNAATSTFYNRLRLLFGSELNNLYVELDGKGAWNAEDLIAQFDASQSQFPEEVWRQDIIRKYIRPYTTSHINDEPDKTFLTNKMNGRKKYHRREFERNQSIYMSSKYRTTSATTKIIRLRSMNMSGDLVVPVNLDLTITPYMHMYVSVDYANGVITRQYRAKAGQPVFIDYPLETGDIVAIENAPYIQSIGDISSFYTGEATLTTATRLKEVLLGNPTEGYSNPNLPDIMMVEDGLVEIINIENIPSLDDELDVSTLRKLKTVLAKGSSITGLILAKNCSAETLSLPSLSSLLSMKNLVYLKDIDFDSLDNLKGLIIEDCDFSTIDSFVIGDKTFESPNELTFLDNASNLNRVRLTGVNWYLPDTSVLERLYSPTIGGYDANGKQTTRSYISGYVNMPGIKQYDLEKYREYWTGLTFDPDITVQPQFVVTFVNDDGTVLDTQYVDQYGDAVEPISAGRISTPTKDSTDSTEYTFAGWDRTFTNIGNNITVTATYSESTRRYSVKYVQTFGNNTTVLYEPEENPEYGTYCFYPLEVPTYTAEEQYSKFYLFNRWDKSGYVNGNKTITAVYDSCYVSSDTYFNGKSITDLSNVEIYALTKLIESKKIALSKNDDGEMCIQGTNISEGDSYSFYMGHDYSYNDLEDEGKIITLIDVSNPRTFNGSTSSYYDTGIAMLDMDKDFVLAVDYEFASGNSSNATLMECYDENNARGFKLSYNNNPTIKWRSKSVQCAVGTNREMLILRHIAGETGLHVYTSNLTGSSVSYVSLDDDVNVPTTFSLIFGCGKRNATTFAYPAKGTVYWAKLWYTDLGEQACNKLATYIHENISLKIAGFNRFYLDNGQLSSIDFIADKPIRTKKRIHDVYTNVGGWAVTTLNTWLNSRFYDGLPSQIQQLLKQVKFKSRSGGSSDVITYSLSYIGIPAISELVGAKDSTYSSEPYTNETDGDPDYILHITPETRIMYDHNNVAVDYWTRSPSDASNGNVYFLYINANGSISIAGTTGASSTERGIVIEFSI